RHVAGVGPQARSPLARHNQDASDQGHESHGQRAAERLTADERGNRHVLESRDGKARQRRLGKARASAAPTGAALAVLQYSVTRSQAPPGNALTRGSASLTLVGEAEPRV